MKHCRSLHSPLIAAMLVLLLASSVSCERRPDGVLSKGKMRSVLYDYHLAQGMIETLPAGKEKEGDLYIDAVFRKHHITVAQFDSSMVWYNAHNKELQEIYSDLKKQFTARSEEIQLITGSSELATFNSEGGDTVDIWVGPRTLLLRPRDILRAETFTLKADTSFRSNDKFLLLANVVFIDGGNSRDERFFSAALTLHNHQKHTFSDVSSMVRTNSLRLEISQVDTALLRDVSVYFYYQSGGEERNLCVIDGIRLIRMHQAAPPVLSAPAQISDTVSQEALPVRSSQPRLSPNELRERTTEGENNTRIKKMPDVRMPNTVGTSRRRKPNNRTR